jgi:hypothetical protein
MTTRIKRRKKTMAEEITDKVQEVSMADHECILVEEEATVLIHTIFMCMKDKEVAAAISEQLSKIVRVTQAQIQKEAKEAKAGEPRITLASRIPGAH